MAKVIGLEPATSWAVGYSKTHSATNGCIYLLVDIFCSTKNIKLQLLYSYPQGRRYPKLINFDNII